MLGYMVGEYAGRKIDDIRVKVEVKRGDTTLYKKDIHVIPPISEDWEYKIIDNLRKDLNLPNEQANITEGEDEEGLYYRAYNYQSFDGKNNYWSITFYYED